MQALAGEAARGLADVLAPGAVLDAFLGRAGAGVDPAALRSEVRAHRATPVRFLSMASR